jgi:SAM-dependent methyltransferase
MDAEPTATAVDPQVEVNEAIWGHGDLLRDYTGRTLRAPEVMLLVRYREALAGRVLELGCGGGRLSGYLIELAREFHGLDISTTMVTYCRRLYPNGVFEERDLRQLAPYPDGQFDVVFASYNVLDVLDDTERHRVLAEIHRILGDGGLLMMSSHNLAYAPSIPKPTSLRARDPLRSALELLRVPRRVSNHRRLRALQRRDEDHAVLVDEGHDYAILHYYVGRDAQERQLAVAGFELLECLDLDGRPVSRGERAASDPELHYVARRVPNPEPGWGR